MTQKHLAGWLQNMAEHRHSIPPLVVEVVLADGTRHWLLEVTFWEDDDETVVLRIWDFRALGDGGIARLMQKMNDLGSAPQAGWASVEPDLDWANLRIPKSLVAYCIEWHDRMWPIEEAGEPIGFGRPPA